MQPYVDALLWIEKYVFEYIGRACVGSLSCDVVLLKTLLLRFCEVVRVFDFAYRDALVITLMINGLNSQNVVLPNHCGFQRAIQPSARHEANTARPHTS